MLYQVQRWAPKEFRQRRSNGEGGWINNLDGVVRVPYRLPEMLAEPNHTIFIVEGEKDADRLVREGLVATTNAGGAGARSVWPTLARWFEGRRVVILPDNDEAGRRHGEHIAETLSDTVTSIKVVQLPDLNEKGDVSDWLDAGHTIRELRRLVHQIPSGLGIPSGLKIQTARKNTRDSAGSSGLAVCSGGSERDESAAEAPPPDASPDEIEIDRLASLSLIDYGRERKPAAQRLGCPVAILDKAVAAKRHDDTTTAGQVQLLDLYESEPWPDTVDGVDLLNEIASTIRRYVVMDEHSADAAALWVLHTHALDAAYITPRLSISSPEMRCGKTTLLDLLHTMAARPLSVANITTATLFRVLEAAHPTLLIDEVDSFVGDNNELRGVINAGHCRASATVLRCVGDNNDVKPFAVWGAIALAGIGQRPGTITDRSITISLRRKHAGEHVEHLRLDRLETLRPLGRRVVRWVKDHLDELDDADPQIPVELHDRAADNWRILIAIADVAGGAWPQRARAAAIALTGTTEDGESIRTMLLADLRDLFEKEEEDRLTSEEIITHLTKLEDRPWGDFKGGKPISKHRLATLLKPFGVKPKQTWIGKNEKCYHKKDLADAFARYLSPLSQHPPSQTARPLEPAVAVAFSDFQTARNSNQTASYFPAQK